MTVEYHDWNLTGNEVINGDLYIKGKTLNLAGKTLKVNGNLIQTGGYIGCKWRKIRGRGKLHNKRVFIFEDDGRGRLCISKRGF